MLVLEVLNQMAPNEVKLLAFMFLEELDLDQPSQEWEVSFTDRLES